MEIEQLRKEINHLLENIVEHSNSYSENKSIPSLEISFVLAKVNKLHESLMVLKYLLEEQEKKTKKSIASTTEPKPVELIIEKEDTIIVEHNVVAIKKQIITVEDNLKQKSIKKLIDAFSLNDRYLFANELFNKDMNAFNELIKAIDNCSSLDDAKEILSKLDWDYENENVLSFLNSVERRFL
ncbi:MAG: hypothetical protein COX70_05130 [Flavobacteriales bacterium CG_4_10_14_0_2_um_filter_32_8]|nr:MAG: hypothetical protein COX70_05130 [Flavobacteriales bacterium CG_4_10_14_0_2_um_filter_32_8]PJB14022.1 MAG: hypothetical protein CO118_10770 [Flavobacteriales bacterium CG_4_9_14_3_um_filter_32_8]